MSDNLHFCQQPDLPTANPFAADGAYDDAWVMLILEDDAPYVMRTCQGRVAEYHLVKRCDGYAYRIRDFVRYHTEHGRQIIISSETAYRAALGALPSDDVDERTRRPYEPEFLVHSTTHEGWEGIRESGWIKSWSLLKAEGCMAEDRPLGAVLGDPDEFSNYVMLGGGGVWSEIVVSSRQKGRICMDKDATYNPGARIYYQTDDLVRRGLLVRDGYHEKVRGRLSLDLANLVVTRDDVDAGDVTMTPRRFAELADALYARKNAMRKPIDICYWVEPGKLLAGEYPQANHDQAVPTDNLDALLAAGVTAFINLTEEGELKSYAQRLPEGVTCQRFPIKDHNPPSSRAMMVLLLDAIDVHITAGELVYVHCMAGVGRTGTTVGCWLARHHGGGQVGYERLLEAWAQNPNALRWPTPLTKVQMPFVLGWDESAH